MAHEIRSTDKFGEVRSNGQRAWHGLGVEIPAGLSCTATFQQIGLDWQTDLLPLRYDRMTPAGVESCDVPGHRVHVRRDTNQVFGVVSSDYRAIDNATLAEFADTVLGEDAAASCETAGSLFDGRRVFALLRLPTNIVATKGDELATYVAVTNGHGGTAAFAAYPTTVRIVCNNTLRMSEQDLSRGARFMHTGDVAGKLATARLVLGFATKELSRFDVQVQQLVAKRYSVRDLMAFMNRAFEAAYPMPDPKAAPEAAQKWTTKRIETMGTWRGIYDRECQRLPAIADTAWAAFNTVTDWHDHVRGRYAYGSDAQVASNLFGVSHQAKAKTLRLALASIAEGGAS